MRHLETNDWLVLNNIIYRIYTTEDEIKMRQLFLEQLKMLIDFDSADFFLNSRDREEELVNPVFYNCENNHAELYGQIDYSREVLSMGKSMVYRETDIISDEKRLDRPYYKNVYRLNNWHFSLQMVLAQEKRFLGVATFYRTISKDNFRYEDIFILDMLKYHLSYRLDKELKKAKHKENKLTIRETVDRYHLTKREETILGFLMAGADNIQICDELVISLNTLKKHILNIYRKLGIRNRVQLFKMVREHGE